MKHQSVGLTACNCDLVMTTYSPFLVAAASLFSAETQDASPATSPGNSQIRPEESKPPVSETSARTVSNGSDSTTIVADLADDHTPPRHAQVVTGPLLWGHGPLQDQNQHDPTIGDARPPHVDLAEILGQTNGTTCPPSPQQNPPGSKPTLPKILTTAQLEPKNSDSPGTAFYTPSGSGEVVDRRPFDSAVHIRVAYSGSSSPPRDVANSARRVVDVQPLKKRPEPKHPFPMQPLEPPRHNPKTADVGLGHGLKILLTRPSRNTRAISSFSSSPFDEYRRDAGLSRRISETNTPTTPGRGSGSRPRSRLGRDEVRSSKETRFPRQEGRRIIPGWGGNDAGGGGGREEMGMERDDRSHMSTSTDLVSIPNEAEERSRDHSSTQVSSMQQGIRCMIQDTVLIPIQHQSPNPSLMTQLLTKLGVRKYPQPQKHALAQVQKEMSTVPMTMATASSVDTPTAGPGQGRERTMSGFSFVNLMPGSTRGKWNWNK